MNEEENKQQEDVKATEDVSKAFGNESAKKEEVDPTTADQKTPEKKETDQKQEGAESASTQQQSGKTYTQDEVDAMMAKARKKYTGKGDEAVDTKTTLDTEKNGDAEDITNPEAPNTPDVEQDLATGITVDKLAQAELKASMAIGGVNPAKVQRAVRLIDINNVIENGMYSEEKAKQEIETLLQEWPELKTQVSATSNGNGFYFGAPEQEEQNQEEKQQGMFSSIFGNK